MARVLWSAFCHVAFVAVRGLFCRLARRSGVPGREAIALPGAQITPAHQGVARKLRRRRADGDPTVEQERGVRTHPQRLGDMVVGQDDRRAVPREALEEVAEPLGTDGVDAGEGL